MTSHLVRAYVRNKDEVKFTAAFLGMVVSGIVLSDLLTRAITDSPLRRTAWYVFRRLGMNAAAPGAFLLGMYLTGLALLGFDQTKRPQGIVLGIVTLIGFTAMALNGQFFQYLELGELSMIVLGVIAGILYVGLDNLKKVTVVNPDDTSGSALERKGRSQLEFRSAERLIYRLLAVVVVLAFFEAYTNYEPLLQPNLLPNLGVFASFQLLEPNGGQLAMDVVAAAVGLLTAYVFLGYDAGKTYFLAGPKRSGKTHTAIALHQEAVNQGYNPRNESPELLEMKSDLVEGDVDWLNPTREVKDLSFSFTSKGLLRKNIRLEAVDYPGELLRAVPSVARYYSEPEDQLVEEYRGVQTREQWLEMEIKDSIQKEQYYGETTPSDRSEITRADGGVSEDESSKSHDDQDDPFPDPNVGSQSADQIPEADDSSESEDSSENHDGEAAGSESELTPRGMELLRSQIWPSFERADTLLLLIDLERYLRDDSLEADALYNIYDKSEKDAIVIVTKADLVAEEFAESNGWKTAWARASYDEFRTYLQGELSEHPMIEQLFKKVERPYPVGYQTVEPDDENADEFFRELDDRTNLGSKRVEVHGYEYVLERMN